MYNGNQKPGPINGMNPLIYTGSNPNLIIINRRPTTEDIQLFTLGYWWIVPVTDDFPNGEVWILVSKAEGVATWKRLGSGSSVSDVESLAGDSGGAVFPDSDGNIDILGGPGITVDGDPALNKLTVTNNGLIHLQTVRTNNVAVPFLALSGDYFAEYNQFQINLNNIAPAGGANAQLDMYMSTDGGSTFITGISVGCALINVDLGTAASTVVAKTVGGGCPVISSLNSFLSGGGSGQFYLTFGQPLAPQSGLPHFSGTSFGSNAGGTVVSNFSGLVLNNAVRVNYIKFQWDNSTTDILDGVISIYGYNNN
jgi:hypothetical protein